MELHSASQAQLYKVFMNLGRKFDDMKQESLTPSVHKTVMQCFVSCEFFTETPHCGVYKRCPIIFDKLLFEFDN